MRGYARACAQAEFGLHPGGRQFETVTAHHPRSSETMRTVTLVMLTAAVFCTRFPASVPC